MRPSEEKGSSGETGIVLPVEVGKRVLFVDVGINKQSVILGAHAVIEPLVCNNQVSAQDAKGLNIETHLRKRQSNDPEQTR